MGEDGVDDVGLGRLDDADGTDLVNINGWGGWDDTPVTTGAVSNVQFRSAPHSVLITGPDDAVQQYIDAACGGQWTYTIWQYIPSEMTGEPYFIVLNTYADNGDKNWSAQVHMNSATGTVISDFGKEMTTLVTDQWVEIRMDIDLDLDMNVISYNGAVLATQTWTDSVGATGINEIRALDLFANGATDHYYDDISLIEVP